MHVTLCLCENETNKCQKINIQGLPVAERVNYDFVKVTTLTDLLTLFCLYSLRLAETRENNFFNFIFFGFSTLVMNRKAMLFYSIFNTYTHAF